MQAGKTTSVPGLSNPFPW